jgi:AraC-like DNA-binding protein/tetratricopeptide (TPR) repeat protein
MSEIDSPGKEFNHHSRDEKFLQKLREIVEFNLGNEKFGVKDLADTMAMSRFQVYRKLHRLTGKSINQYIREARLESALEMLKNDVATVSEIAFQVGFSSPAYFNKCFHDFYGYPPGELLKNNRSGIATKDSSITTRENNAVAFREGKKLTGTGYIFYAFLILFGMVLIIVVITYLTRIDNLAVQLKLPTGENIAIIPIRNDSPDPDYDYPLSKIYEQISNQLQRIENVNVMSWQFVMQYNENNEDISFDEKEFTAVYFLEGSAQLIGDTLNIKFNLTDARINRQIWENSYSEPFTMDAESDFQNKISEMVVSSIGPLIMTENEDKPDSSKIVSIEALRIYYQANKEFGHFWNDFDTSYVERAMKMYDQVLKVNPGFATAIASKARAHSMVYKNYDSALHYCRKAIETDPEAPLGYWTLANHYYDLGPPDLCIQNFSKTVELLPKEPGPHIKLAYQYIVHKHDIEKGWPYLQKAFRLNPLNPYNYLVISQIYLFIGEYDKAREHALKPMVIDDNNSCWALDIYNQAFAQQNNFKLQLQFLDSICNITSCQDLCNKAYWYLSLHDKDFKKAEQDYDLLIKGESNLQLFDSTYLSYMYKQLGRDQDYEIAINKCLRQCTDRRDDWEENLVSKENLVFIYAILEEKDKTLQHLSELANITYHFHAFDIIEKSPIFDYFNWDHRYHSIYKRIHKRREEMKAQIKEIEERDGLDL